MSEHDNERRIANLESQIRAMAVHLKVNYMVLNDVHSLLTEISPSRLDLKLRLQIERNIKALESFIPSRTDN